MTFYQDKIMMDVRYKQTEYSHKHRMLCVNLQMNIPAVYLTQTVNTSPAQKGWTIAEQILGGAEASESWTLFPLQSRGVSMGSENLNITANVIT